MNHAVHKHLRAPLVLDETDFERENSTRLADQVSHLPKHVQTSMLALATREAIATTHIEVWANDGKSDDVYFAHVTITGNLPTLLGDENKRKLVEQILGRKGFNLDSLRYSANVQTSEI